MKLIMQNLTGYEGLEKYEHILKHIQETRPDTAAANIK